MEGPEQLARARARFLSARPGAATGGRGAEALAALEACGWDPRAILNAGVMAGKELCRNSARKAVEADILSAYATARMASKTTEESN